MHGPSIGSARKGPLALTSGVKDAEFNQGKNKTRESVLTGAWKNCGCDEASHEQVLRDLKAPAPKLQRSFLQQHSPHPTIDFGTIGALTTEQVLNMGLVPHMLVCKTRGLSACRTTSPPSSRTERSDLLWC